MGEGEEDLDEKLDRDRHGSGEFDPEERYGRRGVVPNRSKRNPGDEDAPDEGAGGEDVGDRDDDADLGETGGDEAG